MSQLKRDLGLWSAAAIVVGTVIGSGIFIVPKSMILNVGTPGMVLFVFLFGGLLSLGGKKAISRMGRTRARRIPRRSGFSGLAASTSSSMTKRRSFTGPKRRAKTAWISDSLDPKW